MQISHHAVSGFEQTDIPIDYPRRTLKTRLPLIRASQEGVKAPIRRQPPMRIAFSNPRHVDPQLKIPAHMGKPDPGQVFPVFLVPRPKVLRDRFGVELCGLLRLFGCEFVIPQNEIGDVIAGHRVIPDGQFWQINRGRDVDVWGDGDRPLGVYNKSPRGLLIWPFHPFAQAQRDATVGPQTSPGVFLFVVLFDIRKRACRILGWCFSNPFAASGANQD